ncbi:MAG: hypothetical protein EOP06_29335, partial [Proteobacteria bacterium]
MNIQLLQNLSETSRVAWVGELPPVLSYQAISAPLDGSRIYRSHPELHQRFDVVFLVEQDLGALKHWRQTLDDVLRLISPGGRLVLKFSESSFLSIYALKFFLSNWTNREVAIESEFRNLDGQYTIGLRLTRLTKREDSLDDWTFAIISDGKRPEAVQTFVESVLRLQGLDKFEILICGPNPLFPLPPQLRVITPPEQFQTQGWITRKKNEIVAAAQYSNLVVAHDRYVLPSDFLKKMYLYGGDFDVLTPRQETLDGSRFPDWVTVGSDWNWSPGALMEPHDDSPFGYLNGGFIIAKTAILRETPWNDLLFWNQAEDVELTRQLANRGRVHRYAPSVVVISTVARQQYVRDFLK